MRMGVKTVKKGMFKSNLLYEMTTAQTYFYEKAAQRNCWNQLKSTSEATKR